MSGQGSIQFAASAAEVTDIYATVSEAQQGFYNDLMSAMSSLQEGSGEVTLADGTKIDMNSVSGMTVFTVHIQFVQANLEMINNIFGFIKTFESKLENLLSS